MKLRFINLAEGFGFRTDHDPEAVMAQAELKTPNYKPLFANDTIYFNPTDSQEDVIKVVPAMKAETLKPYVDRYQLPNFTGTIYYGFKTVLGDDYRNKTIETILTPLEATLKHAGEGVTVKDCFDIAKEYSDPRRWGKPGPPRPDLAELMANAGHLALKLRQLYKWKQGTQDTLPIKQAIALVKERTGRGYAKEASYQLAQRLKNPKADDQEVVNRFMEMCVEQIGKLPGTAVAYDYVIAPASKGSFNQSLAKLIARDRGSEFLIIGKRLGKDVTVGADQIRERARRLEAPRCKKKDERGRDVWILTVRGDKISYYTEDEFVEAWSTNEINKLQTAQRKMKSDVEPEIKAQDYKDKRRYLKIYSKAGAEATSDKAVLLIDDNIVSGGTLELIHEVLIQVQPPPRRIDIFVPLLITVT